MSWVYLYDIGQAAQDYSIISIASTNTTNTLYYRVYGNRVKVSIYDRVFLSEPIPALAFNQWNMITFVRN